MTDSTSSKIIQYIGEMSDVFRKLDQLDARNRQVAGNVSSDFTKSFTKVGDGLGKITKKFDVNPVNSQLTETKERLSSVSETLKDTDGNFIKYTATTKTSADGTKTLTESYKDLDKNTVSLGDNMARLAKRAALTIPLWIALRAVIIGIPRAFADGVKGLVEFDRALQKIQRNLQGSAKEISTDLASIRSEITKLSIATGTSTEDIAEAIKKFATIGFDTKEALAGGIGATKLSILLFGEAGDTANAFARALKILIDRSAGAKSATEQMNEAFALTANLEKTNQFELDEVTQGLEKFATTAKVANLSMSQTLALLATLGTAAVGGARGGTLLRTSFQKLVENLDEVQRQLGVKVNPQLDSTFDVLIKVVDALSKLDQSSLIAVETTGALADIFGGVRGSLPIQALVALNTQLKQNLEVTGDVVKFNKSVSDILETESKSSDRLKNNVKELKKAFVESLVGGEQLHKIIKGLADDTGKATEGVKATADAIRNFTAALLLLSAPGILKGALGLGISIGTKISAGMAIGANASAIEHALTIQLLKMTAKMGVTGAILGKSLGTGLLAGAVSTFNVAALVAIIAGALANTALDIKMRGINVDNKQILDASDQLLKGLRGELGKSDLADLFAKAKVGEIKATPKDIEILFKNFQKLLEKETDKSPINVKAKITASLDEINQISQLIIDAQVEQLKNQGALESEALKLKNTLLEKFNIDQDDLKILERQLGIEQAKTKETRLQSNLGSDSIKLFKIAQEQGTDVAKKIGEVLSKDVDFSSFVRRGGEAVDIFKKEFADVFEQQQAEAFFAGNRVPGEKGLRGGTRIPIEERKDTNLLAKAQAELSKAISKFETIKNDLVKPQKSTEDNTKALNDNTKALLTSIPALRGALTNDDINKIAPRGADQGLFDQNQKVAQAGIDKFNQLLSTNRLIPQVISDQERQKAAFFSPIAPPQPTTLPVEMRNREIVFGNGALNINIASSVSKEEAQKLVDETFIKMGTPGTKENSTVKTVITKF
jgi:TP901 family phage tail tape measure protein